MKFIEIIIGIWVAIVAFQYLALQGRIRKARDFKPPNIHGNRTIASRKQLKKAGLL
jgi:hypothetical protein